MAFQFTRLAPYGTTGTLNGFGATLAEEVYGDPVLSVACVTKFYSLTQAKDFCFASVSPIKGIDRISKNVKVCQIEEVN